MNGSKVKRQLTSLLLLMAALCAVLSVEVICTHSGHANHEHEHEVLHDHDHIHSEAAHLTSLAHSHCDDPCHECFDAAGLLTWLGTFVPTTPVQPLVTAWVAFVAERKFGRPVALPVRAMLSNTFHIITVVMRH